MKTKYGEIKESVVSNAEKPLVGKIFKLLPLKESNSPTLRGYHKSLMLELLGIENAVLQDDPYFLSLIGSVESLLLVEDNATYRTKVFECITAIKQIIHRVEGGESSEL